MNEYWRIGDSRVPVYDLRLNKLVQHSNQVDVVSHRFGVVESYHSVIVIGMSSPRWVMFCTPNYVKPTAIYVERRTLDVQLLVLSATHTTYFLMTHQDFIELNTMCGVKRHLWKEEGF